MNAWEYSYIQQEILSLTGIDLSDYKSAQVQRRLAAYLLKSGCSTWRRLFQVVRGTPGAADDLKQYLTINVSAFFRDSEQFTHLRKTILPDLLHPPATFHVWSAGCSYGQESYSLAMLLNSLHPSDQRYRILATDLDESALAIARAGGPYSVNDAANVPLDLGHHLVPRPAGYWISETLRHQIRFRQHDLLRDPFIGSFDLIVCRNVTIYFTRAAQDRLYRRFHDVLRPHGVLFVGATEMVSRPGLAGFEPVGVSFYRKT